MPGRSHPYVPPPPLPPLLDDIADELSSILPNQSGPDRRGSDTEIELGELDPDTSRLIPIRPKRHHVRVQGKLVVVRSVSTAILRPTVSGSPSRDRPVSIVAGPVTGRYESAVGSTTAPRSSKRRSRRRSLDDGAAEEGSETETEEEVRETGIRDRQWRGYGIGGAGNIRKS